MFCKNCGNQLSGGAKFCNNCGSAVESKAQVASVFQATAQKPKSKGKKIGGIIMVVLGGLSVLGSFMNDYYWNIAHNGFNMSDFVTIGLQFGLLAAGARLIYKAKK